MESHKTRRDMVAVAVAVALALPLAACSSGGSSGSSGSSAVVTTLNVVDYYNNEPDNGFYQKALDACGQANGITIQRQAIPGASLIAKVCLLYTSDAADEEDSVDLG